MSNQNAKGTGARKSFKRKEGKERGPPAKRLKGEQWQSSTGKKRALKHERQSHRKHADAVVSAKEIWNKLRLKNKNSPEEVRNLMVELMGLIRGKMNEIALQHDASRVVQAAVQFGAMDERKEIARELCVGSNLAELAKVQYAHFVVLKLIKYCSRDEECVGRIVKSLKGHITKLAVHAVGARVVELLFSEFPRRSTSVLKQEFYGPHFALFVSGDLSATSSSNPTLESNLEAAPEKREAALAFVMSIINKGIDKGLFGHEFFQQLLDEYVSTAGPTNVQKLAPSIVDHSVQLLSTRPGTRVVVACASYGTAKDRKRIIKSLKGYTRSSLLHQEAYLAILRIVQVTDDTVSVNKSVLNEILVLPEDIEDRDQSSLLEIALDKSASKFLLTLLVSKEESRQKYLDPYERDQLKANPCVIEDGKEVPTSKKDPEVRRTELLSKLEKPLLDLCLKHTDTLMRSIEGSRVLKEVYAASHPEELVDAIVDACDDNITDDNSGSSFVPAFEDRIAHRTLKSILQVDAEAEEANDRSGSEATFARRFVTRFGSCLDSVGSSSRGAFILVALLNVQSVRPDVMKKIVNHEKEIRKLAGGDKPTAGFEALLREIDDSKQERSK